jgi:hypothetical protein
MNTKTTTNGFTWLIVTEKAKEIFTSGLFELYLLHDNDAESLINSYEELNEILEKGGNIGIEVGYVGGVSEEWAEAHFQFAVLAESDIAVEGTIANEKGMGGAWELSYKLTNDFMKHWEELGSDEISWFDELEAFYNERRLPTANDAPILFARKCSISGKGMNQGFCFRSGEHYASTIEYANAIAVLVYAYKSWEDMFNKECSEEEEQALEGNDNYYTEWDAEEDAEFIEINGELKPYEKAN